MEKQESGASLAGGDIPYKNQHPGGLNKGYFYLLSPEWNFVLKYDFEEAKIEWFGGGVLNACCNCLDRHMEKLEHKVVGHVVVLPDFDKGDAEYLIFVDQFNRGVGVGSELTRAAIKKAEEPGLKTVWLTVDACNFRATKLYKKDLFVLIRKRPFPDSGIQHSCTGPATPLFLCWFSF